MADIDARLRSLPAVDALAASLESDGITHAQQIAVARSAIDQARAEIRDGGEPDAMSIASGLITTLTTSRPQRVINATGVLLHTNLGRAPLSTAASDAAASVARSYSNTELQLDSGDRGRRGSYTSHLLCLLTGAEAAMVVNNNAAAVMLALSSLAPARAVPVSRGELIEIGGSYRLPDVMRASGARLVEVGTTNKTRLGDFETAIQIHDCGALLKVHAANYEISGFVGEVTVSDLAGVAHSNDLPLVYDIGSGLLDSMTPWLAQTPQWVREEPGARQAIESGADLVLFSGDKLLGGPQAGIIVGTRRMVDRLRSHPIARAVRVSAPVDAAVAATLDAYARNAAVEIPFWQMATATLETLQVRAEAVAGATGGAVIDGSSMIGAGSAPGARLPSAPIAYDRRSEAFNNLLRAPIPVLGRRDRGRLILDLRTVDPTEDEQLIQIIKQCL